MRERVARGIALAVAVVLLSACAANPFARRFAAPPAVPMAPAAAHCAELVVKALTSPNQVVAGSFNCLDPYQQTGVQPPSDAGLQSAAQQPPVFTQYAYWAQGRSGAYYFNVSNPQTGDKGCYYLLENAGGLVTNGGFLRSACPPLLPVTPAP